MSAVEILITALWVYFGARLAASTVILGLGWRRYVVRSRLNGGGTLHEIEAAEPGVSAVDFIQHGRRAQ